MIFSNILGVCTYTSKMAGSDGTQWNMIQMIMALAFDNNYITTTWMHNGQLGWNGPVLLVLTIWLSGVGSVPHSFILILLIQLGHMSVTVLIILGVIVYNSMGILCTWVMAVIKYANATIPFVVTAGQLCGIWLLTTWHAVTNVRLKFAPMIPK